MRKYIGYLATVVLFFPALLHAQDMPRTVRLGVIRIENAHDSLLLHIDGGSNIGLKEMNTGTLYKVPDKEHSFSGDIGAVRLISVGADESVALVRDQLQGTEVNLHDQVFLNVIVPARHHPNRFFELALGHVFFRDFNNGQSFYTLYEVAANDRPGVEDSLMNAIVTSAGILYQAIKDETDTSVIWNRRAPAGRYNGKPFKQLMKDFTRADLDHFLQYVETYPGTYYDSEYHLLESWAGWFFAGAPYSLAEIKINLVPIFRNKALLQQKIGAYRQSIVTENLGKRLGDDASDLNLAGRTSDADELIAFATALVEACNDDHGRAGVYLMNAQILQDRGLYKDAVGFCDRSLNISEPFNRSTDEQYASYKELEVKTLIKKGFCLYMAASYQPARATLDRAFASLKRNRKAVGEDTYLLNMYKRYSYAGYFDYLNKDYNHALPNYRAAIRYNDSLVSADQDLSRADMLVYVGKILIAQNQNEEALKELKQAEAIYADHRMPSKQSEAITQQGSALFGMTSYQASIDEFNRSYELALGNDDGENAGFASSFTGNAWWNLGRYDLAIAAHQRAIELRQGSVAGLAYSWYQLGKLYQVSGSKNQALQALDSAIRYYRAAGDSSGVSEVYENKGKVYYQDELYRNAIGWYELAKNSGETVPASVLFNLGNAWLEIDSSKARRNFETCLLISKRTGDPDYEFASLTALIRLNFRTGNLKAMNAYLAQASTLSAKLNSPFNTAELLSLRGYIKREQLDIDSAVVYYEQALRVIDTLNQSVSVIYLNELSNLHISRGEFNLARQELDRAITLARSSSNYIDLGYTLNNASFLNGLLGDFTTGMVQNDSAIAIFERTGNRMRLANSYSSKAALLTSAGRYRSSVEAYQVSDSIYTAEGITSMKSVIMNNIGTNYFHQGDYPGCIEYFNRSLALLKPGVYSEDYFLSAGNVAEACYFMQKYDEAEKILLKIYPIARKQGYHRLAMTMSLTLAKIAYEKKAWSQAEEYLSYARTYSDKGSNQSYADAYVVSGKTQAVLGHYDQATAYFNKAIGVARRYSLGSQGWVSYYEAGIFFYDRGLYDSAINNLKAAVDLVEKSGEYLLGGAGAKEIYNNDPRKVNMYSRLASAFLKTNREKEAFAYANRSNITGLQVLSGAETSTGDAARTQALTDLNVLQQKKQALEKTAAELDKNRVDTISGQKILAIRQERKIVEAEYARYVEELVQKYPDIGLYFQRNANPDDFYNYKGELPDDVAVVLYLPNGNDLMIFTLTNEDLSVYVVELKSNIAKAINAFKSLTRNRAKGTGTGAVSVRSEVIDEEETPSNLSFTDVSAELYGLLIGSVKDKIAGKKKLCIIPNGNLSNLPFQCLGRKEGGQFHFLLDDYAIFYSNQLDIFKGSREGVSAKHPMASFAAFGVPDNTLRFNIEEVKSIGHIMHSDSTVYADGRATEAAARLGLMQKKIIHFATHGTLNYNDYNQSYLKMLPDKDTSGGMNGRFTIDEIRSLAIPGCDLVTLSACETAVNNELIKGWNISPANTFLRRKVKSVVASLWKVDDEATNLLMQSFYTNLVNGSSKVEALRNAQATLSANPKYAHPYFWGAFVLFGDWR